MAKKDVVSDVMPRGTPWIETGTSGILFIAGIFILGCCTYRNGYRTGLSVSSQMLRRHDKDIRRMEKKAAKEKKELKSELQPKKKKWFW